MGMGTGKFFHLFTEGFDRHPWIDVQIDLAHDVLTVPRPVLKSFFDEEGDGENEPSLVPDPDHDVGERDLLDDPPFPFHMDGVIDLDGLGEGDLKTVDQVADGLLSRKPDDDPDDRGRSEQRGPDPLNRFETEQDPSCNEQNDQNAQRLFQELDLRPDLSFLQILVASDLVGIEKAILEDVEPLDQKPSQVEEKKDDEDLGAKLFDPGRELEVRKAGIDQQKGKKDLDAASEMIPDGIPNVSGGWREATKEKGKSEASQKPTDEPA